ncbi:MAG: nucleoside deaminase [Actinomycetota bacterium]
MTTAAEVWAGLDEPWHAAFDEAWTSWTEGNFGIGAVLFDPVARRIVTRGRNRVTEPKPGERQLGGNMLAHAEMNAFAGMESWDARGLHLYTTLEPCLMCAATATQLRVEHVHLAVDDEFYDGLHEVWAEHPFTAKRTPSRTGPFAGGAARLASFARLLPLTFTHDRLSGQNAWAEARRRVPALAALAGDQDVRHRLRACDSAEAGLTELWDELPH